VPYSTHPCLTSAQAGKFLLRKNFFYAGNDKRSSASPLPLIGAASGGNEADAAYQAANGFARNALRALPPAAAPLAEIRQ